MRRKKERENFCKERLMDVSKKDRERKSEKKEGGKNET